MLRALVLGAVQGLTEFVPISSSGHLVLVPFVLGWEHPGLPFDVAVHLGTALAVVMYFRRELANLVSGTARSLARRGDDHDRSLARIAGLLAIGSIPAALAGQFLEGFFEGLFHRPAAVALSLLGTAALLVLGEAVYARRRPEEPRDMWQVGLPDVLLIGVFQAVAIAPGISRSGSTITAGLLRGLSRDAAARFSFLLGLPAILGAGLLQVPELTEFQAVEVVGATAVSAGAGFVAIAFLLRFLRTRTMLPFAGYCVVASLSALAVAAVR